VSVSLRIVITADPYLPVPPRLYGGIERVVHVLVSGLARRGHDVTLIAHPDSTTPARLVGYGVPPHRSPLARGRELLQVASALASRRRSVDVVHSFGRLAAMAPVLPMRGIRKVQSYQRAIPWQGVQRAGVLARGSLWFTGCSTSLYSGADGARDARRWRTVFNCVDVSRYSARDAVAPDAPLVWLGRIEPIKGTHHAVTIARAASRRLVIAGNVTDRDYFRTRVQPAIDGTQITYIGEVDDDAKNALLGQAAALLMPIEWEEPFGIVMAEALACGTPVIGFARGSVPEVVRHGETGFVVSDPDAAVAAVAALSRIDRRAARADCERRFSCEAVVDAYERLYGEVLG
jgi:glycosyltransferase involved in cell wall biosynthesis